jgi:hypothetical protein
MSENKRGEPIEHCAVSDALFSQAYESLGDRERGWLKKCIAQLYAWYSLSPRERMSTQCLWRAGFFSLSCCEALQWSVIVVHQQYPCPSQLLAAAFPPFMAGVQDIFVVIIDEGNEPDFRLLAALELAGIEKVFYGSFEDVGALLNSFQADQSSGLIISLGIYKSLAAELKSCFFSPNIQRIHLETPTKMALWSDASENWQYDILQFFHPGVTFEVWGKEKGCIPTGWISKDGDWSQFVLQKYHVVFVPARYVRLVCSSASLVLTPGQENCWLWPQFPWDLCWAFRVSLSDAISGSFGTDCFQPTE